MIIVNTNTQSPGPASLVEGPVGRVGGNRVANRGMIGTVMEAAKGMPHKRL
jgi:hypothetical protein